MKKFDHNSVLTSGATRFNRYPRRPLSKLPAWYLLECRKKLRDAKKMTISESYLLVYIQENIKSIEARLKDESY